MLFGEANHPDIIFNPLMVDPRGQPQLYEQKEKQNIELLAMGATRGYANNISPQVALVLVLESICPL